MSTLNKVIEIENTVKTLKEENLQLKRAVETLSQNIIRLYNAIDASSNSISTVHRTLVSIVQAIGNSTNTDIKSILKDANRVMRQADDEDSKSKIEQLKALKLIETSSSITDKSLVVAEVVDKDSGETLYSYAVLEIGPMENNEKFSNLVKLLKEHDLASNTPLEVDAAAFNSSDGRSTLLLKIKEVYNIKDNINIQGYTLTQKQ
jgi:hypothetical protein